MDFRRGLAQCAALLPLLTFCAAQYRVVEWEARVAVEETATQTVCWRSDIPLTLLPPADAQKIRSGIACEDAAEVARVVENFCS